MKWKYRSCLVVHLLLYQCIKNNFNPNKVRTSFKTNRTIYILPQFVLTNIITFANHATTFSQVLYRDAYKIAPRTQVVQLRGITSKKKSFLQPRIQDGRPIKQCVHSLTLCCTKHAPISDIRNPRFYFS